MVFLDSLEFQAAKISKGLRIAKEMTEKPHNPSYF